MENAAFDRDLNVCPLEDVLRHFSSTFLRSFRGWAYLPGDQDAFELSPFGSEWLRDSLPQHAEGIWFFLFSSLISACLYTTRMQYFQTSEHFQRQLNQSGKCGWHTSLLYHGC